MHVNNGQNHLVTGGNRPPHKHIMYPSEDELLKCFGPGNYDQNLLRN